MDDYEVTVYYNKTILEKNDLGYIFINVKTAYIDEDGYLRILFNNGDITFINRDSFYRYDVTPR